MDLFRMEIARQGNVMRGGRRYYGTYVDVISAIFNCYRYFYLAKENNARTSSRSSGWGVIG